MQIPWMHEHALTHTLCTCQRTRYAAQRRGAHPLDARFALGVLEHRDLVRRRKHALLEQRGAEQRVDDAALAAVELADDDEQEGLVETCTPQVVGNTAVSLQRQDCEHLQTAAVERLSAAVHMRFAAGPDGRGAWYP
jgi:hypothetical protein